WPRFDSPACFAALLGRPEHGRWTLHPADDAGTISRTYRDHSLILETRFDTAGGAATLIDFMPPRGDNSDVVRLVRGDSGRVRMTMELVLRFDYGSIVPWVSRLSDGTWRAIAGPDMVVLRTPVEVKGRDLTTVAEFDVAAGETVPFVLTYGASHKPPPEAIDPFASLRGTETFWKDWGARACGDGEWCDAVMRSLIVLKALTYAPTGGIVAAPTTSLPEQLGGTRLARLAAARRRGGAAPAADHVRVGRRAAAARMGGDLASRLRAVVPRSRRQRRARPAAARRVRRGDGRAASGAARRHQHGHVGVAVREGAAGAPRAHLVAAGPGDVGSTRTGAALHLLEGDGVGRLRPRGEDGRALRPRRPGGAVARRPAADPRGGLRARLRPPARLLRPG